MKSSSSEKKNDFDGETGTTGRREKPSFVEGRWYGIRIFYEEKMISVPQFFLIVAVLDSWE